MMLREVLHKLARPIPVVYAALCTGRAGEQQGQYPAGERHAILVMMRVAASPIEIAATALLESYGWRSVVVEEWKQLEMPFFSEDRQVTACYVNAMTSDGGLVVYADPLHAAETAWPIPE